VQTLSYGSAIIITANMEQDMCFVDKQTVANRCDYVPEKHRGW
jgi:hypothetical protein